MPVTTSNYTVGGNTKIVSIANETSSTNVISAVEAVFTGAGWTAFDTVAVTLFNPIVTKVYRAPNADGVTFKFFVIRWDTVQLKFYTSVCESWSTVTQQPTNESWTQAGGFAQGYDIYSSFILISISARHAVIWPFINGQAGLWTGVLEFERVAGEDIASINTAPYPCFAWTNSVMIGTPWGSAAGFTGANAPAQSQIMFAFPRLPDGTVGPNAAFLTVPMTNKGMMPPYLSNGVYTTIAGDNNFLHMGSYFRNLIYRWDVTNLRSPYTPFSVDGIQRSMGFGRAYNFGVLRPVGTLGDTIYANVDPTGGWPSSNVSTSTNTECLLLPMNGGIEANAQVATPQYGGGLFTYTPLNTNTAAVTNSVPGKVIAIGDNIWIAANDGIRTGSISAGVNSSCTLRVQTPPQTPVLDIVFDGKRTVYGSTANGILRVDVLTFVSNIATSAQTIANGCAYLGIDNKNVYATNRTANTRPSIVVLDQASFSISTSNTFVHLGTIPPIAGAGYSTPVPDYRGNVHSIMLPGTTAGSSAHAAISSFTANTGVGTTFNNPLGTITNYGGNGMYYDYITNRLWSITANPASNAYTLQEHYPANLNIISSSTGQNQVTGLSQTVTNFGNQLFFYGNTTIDYLGDLSIVPFRGYHFFAPKRPGLASGVATPGVFTTLIWPGQAANVFPSTFQVGINNTAITGGLPQHPFASSGGLWTNGSQLFASYYSVNVVNQSSIINGLYTAQNSSGISTSRLLVRG